MKARAPPVITLPLSTTHSIPLVFSSSADRESVESQPDSSALATGETVQNPSMKEVVGSGRESQLTGAQSPRVGWKKQ